ncbi:hypothetical protein ACIQXI_06515 [Lysinibacillus sp. NPDC097195]|uniref:hypothetical protein n=1 Tax=Lysinibacillus sp. NPDC097195 TaxID=3364141 RepID=UPI00381F0E87
MSYKYNKYVSFIIVITLLLLILFFTNKVSKEVFLLIYVPLSIAMLIFGILVLKNTLKDKEDIDLHATEIKRRLKNTMKKE